MSDSPSAVLPPLLFKLLRVQHVTSHVRDLRSDERHERHSHGSMGRAQRDGERKPLQRQREPAGEY